MELLDCCPLPPYDATTLWAKLAGGAPAAPDAPTRADEWIDTPMPGWRAPLDAAALVEYANRADRTPAWTELWGAAEHPPGSSDMRMVVLGTLIAEAGGNCQAVYDAVEDRPGINKRGETLLRAEIQRAYARWYESDRAQAARARHVESTAADAAPEGDGAAPWRVFSTEDEMVRDLRMILTPGADEILDVVTGRVTLLKHAAMTLGASTVAMEDGKQRPMWGTRVSSRLRRYSGLVWAPAAPRSVAVRGRDPLLNTWQGFPDRAPPPRAEEYVTEFLAHVEYLVPVPAQRRDFLDWLAHIVQYPGVLSHQCFYFATPLTGTGRGLLSRMLVATFGTFALPGANANALFGNDKNGEFDRKLLCIIDECRTLTDGAGRAQARPRSRAKRLAGGGTRGARQPRAQGPYLR